MARYNHQISGGSKGPNPPEWGTLNESQVLKATLMEHENHLYARYILEDDVERLQGKGWTIKGGRDVYRPQAKTKTKARARSEVTK